MCDAERRRALSSGLGTHKCVYVCACVTERECVSQRESVCHTERVCVTERECVRESERADRVAAWATPSAAARAPERQYTYGHADVRWMLNLQMHAQSSFRWTLNLAVPVHLRTRGGSRHVSTNVVCTLRAAARAPERQYTCGHANVPHSQNRG